MISGILAPHVSFAPKDRPNPFTHCSSETVTAPICETVPYGDHIYLRKGRGRKRPPVWNNVTSTGKGNTIVACGNRLTGFTSDLEQSPSVDLACGNVIEVVGTRLHASTILARDEAGLVSVCKLGFDGRLLCDKTSMYSPGVRFAISPDPGQFCVSAQGSVSIVDRALLESPFSFLFPSDGEPPGPVAFSPSDPNIIYHGAPKAVSVLDIREGGEVGQIRAHPASVSMLAYTKRMDYSLVTVNPVRHTEIAAVSSHQQVVQIFDSRFAQSPLHEYALPGREFFAFPEQHLGILQWPYRHIEYSPDGSSLLLTRPCDMVGFVVSVGGTVVPAPLTQKESEQVKIFNSNLSETCKDRFSNALRARRLRDCGVYPLPWPVDCPFEVSLGSTFDSPSSILSFSSTGVLRRTSASIVLSSEELSQDIGATGQPYKRNAAEVITHPLKYDLEEKKVTSLGAIFQRIEYVENKHPCRLVDRPLNRKQQLWVLCYIEAVRMRECSVHVRARNSAPGSYWWNECVSLCGCKPQSGPPVRSHTPVTKKTFLSNILQVYFEMFGTPLPKNRVIEFIQRVSAETTFPWITIGFDGSAVTVNVGNVESYTTDDTRKPRAKNKGMVEKADTDEERRAADTPPLPIGGELEDDDGDSIDLIFDEKVELKKPQLLVKKLFEGHPGNHRTLSREVLDSLKSMWPDSRPAPAVKPAPLTSVSAKIETSVVVEEVVSGMVPIADDIPLHQRLAGKVRFSSAGF